MHMLSKVRHICDFRLDEAIKYKQMVQATHHYVLDG